MKNEDIFKQFIEFGKESVFPLAFEDTEEYRVIRGQIMIERLLDSLLEHNLGKYKTLIKRHRIYFDLKIDLCISLNLIPDKLGIALHTLNKIRNKLSHEKSPNISQDEIRKLNTGFYKEPMFQKALESVYEEGYKDALMLSTLLLYWEVNRLVIDIKK